MTVYETQADHADPRHVERAGASGGFVAAVIVMCIAGEILARIAFWT